MTKFARFLAMSSLYPKPLFFDVIFPGCMRRDTISIYYINIIWTKNFYFIFFYPHIRKYFCTAFSIFIAHRMIPCFVSRFCKNRWRHIFYLDDPCNLCHSEFSSVVGNVILILVMLEKARFFFLHHVEKYE